VNLDNTKYQQSWGLAGLKVDSTLAVMFVIKEGQTKIEAATEMLNQWLAELNARGIFHFEVTLKAGFHIYAFMPSQLLKVCIEFV
jgi:hypothetical protein